jgi:methyl-accepting chemotaxis protein
MTIKRKLLGFTIIGLVFVLAISIVGYWGISTVKQTTAEVAATGSAIRNHVEAGVYNDLTRSDMSAIFTAKGDEQQNKVEELGRHSNLLKDRLTKTEQLVSEPALHDSVSQEARLAEQYIAAGQSLASAIVHSPDRAVTQLGPYLQLYKQLQQNIEQTSDKLEKGAKQAQEQAQSKAVDANRAMLTMCAFSLFLLSLVARQITRSITKPLDSLSSKFETMAESNDLTAHVEEDRADEIGALGVCLNTFVKKLHDILAQIRNSSGQVAEVAEEISASAKAQAQGAERQNDQTAQVATAMQQMSATVLQVSENSTRAADAARKASETARHGGSIVDGTLAKMRVIESSVTNTATKVAELGKSSDQIGRIIGVIDDIADQTNLLALNAAIEAARAGEQGRGFAVVADEVRKLAERTTKATKEIAQMIKTIQSDTQTAVKAMEEGTVQVKDGVQSTAQAGDALREIIQMAEQVGDMITQIATAGTEQFTTAEQVKESMQQIATLVKQTATEARNSAQACEGLSEFAADLQKMVANFRLNGDANEPSRRLRKDSETDESHFSLNSSDPEMRAHAAAAR